MELADGELPGVANPQDPMLDAGDTMQPPDEAPLPADDESIDGIERCAQPVNFKTSLPSDVSCVKQDHASLWASKPYAVFQPELCISGSKGVAVVDTLVSMMVPHLH